ncbi:Retrovirus-related Pol polyprotein from transposon TNT 1-94 [Symbiodinium microadriaticum]|uniref:Retrovirus-related Pol polyprotein from transposon TNT 1-94 n=1 Tax=Symbiodinium microadriaticum TaxID=2951 RepID=A0A1Q9BWU3_SYMMI|nr:Retrovirus-related Pol polyprotein from transposon TNT 1-94 [Symbiodinium microadriaticum]OLP99382.1 Retrovirus-related Pol polyprotein from transposon TNT 1-94 [Symbiodinium microadriaticum]
MSAQAGGDAPLREEQQGRPMEATEQAEETAATSSGAVGSTVPEGPQMNGGGSGGGRISSEAIPAAAPSGDHASYSAMGGYQVVQYQKGVILKEAAGVSEFISSRTPSPEGRVREVPGAISAEHNRAGGAEESSTTAILEALTKNLVGLQELQLKTMKKEGDDDSPEQVKNTSVILPALLGPEEPSAGIVFQDWLAQVSVPMQDLSASSSIWWQQVLKMVQATYNKWLSANPLERLQLEPADQEALTTMKWTRVNSRACTLILQCLVETVRWLQRCKDLNMMVPDGSFTKAEKAKRCLICGSEEHRQKDCGAKPQKSWPKGGNGAAPTAPAKAEGAARPPDGPKVQAMEPEGESSPASQSVVAGEAVWTLESLIQAAAKVAAASPQAPKAPTLKVLAIRHSGVGDLPRSSFALVDSGATHALRRAFTEEEWAAANPVIVNLAGGESVSLRMNEAGTILVPRASDTTSSSSAPIVPLGALVSQLGYTMVWERNKCKLESRHGEVINLRVRDGCPEIMEHEALKLIAQLEDKRLEELRSSTVVTKQRIKAAALAMNKTWFDHLLTYVDSTLTSEAYKSIEAATFLEGIPKQCVAGMFDAIPENNGWNVLKGLKHLNRKSRKRLWSSKSWMVHLFAGDRKKPELYHLENHGHVVLELDIERGRSQNILSPEVWRVLEWAAREGRITGIVGGPPQGSFMISRHIVGGPEPLRSNEYPYGGWTGQSDSDVFEVNKHTSLYVRMIFLHALATAGRIRNPGEPGAIKEVAFMMEQPKDPRGYLKFQDPLYEDVVSFWRTPLWMEYALEAGLRTYSFDMAAFGKAFVRLTTVGTNLPLEHLHGLRARASYGDPPPEPTPPRVWPPEFLEQVTLALRKWGQVPRMLRMSADQWREHVQRGHLPFRADCAVCVQAGATGRRHSRVEHPSAFVLSADLSGPVKVGGVDPDGRGAYPKPFKYIFAAKLRVPRSFVEDGRGVWLSYDPGELGKDEYYEEEDGLAPVESDPSRERPVDNTADPADDPEAELKEAPRRDPELDPDLAGPELVNLIFSCGLKDDKATSVLEAIQDVVLYCRSLNIPILRFHTDKGMEFRARATQQWLKGEGIRVTASEPGVHQTNGAAEATVRWLKQRVRTLLLSAGLPTHLWPSALSAASAMQRGDVLGFEPKLAAPYGSKVMVRRRHMEGPKQEDLAPKWVSGTYIGLSDSLSKGHLVYVQDADGERFIHTLHVRAGLHDPGAVGGDYVADLPEAPERRVRGKSAGSGDVVALSKAILLDEEEFQARAEQLLASWSQEEAEVLVLEVARALPEEERIYGMFRHGGRLGITKATVERPWFVKVLNRMFKDRAPDAEYAAVFVSVNNEREIHIDRNNALGTVNYILPLCMPRRGGELWLELRHGDTVSGKILELATREGRARYGCAYSLQEGVVFTFDPHRRHAILPWKGERIAVVGYTPGLLSHAQRADKEALWDLQFPLPLDEEEGNYIPEIAINAMSVRHQVHDKGFEEESTPMKGGGWSEVVPTSDGDYLFKCDWSISKTPRSSSKLVGRTDDAQEDCSVPCEEWDDWEMRLVLDNGGEDTATAKLCRGGDQEPSIHKAEVAYTEDAEGLLSGLSAPLSVVHTVSPTEAATHLESWIPAIAKEAQSLEHAVAKVQESEPGVKQEISSGAAQVIPMKLVFTLKPPDADGQGLYKRKARIVICGNMATHKPDDVFASTAPAEVVRAAIALATYFNWDLGLIDIVAAFLQTPLHAVKGAPRVYGRPPRLLVKAGICRPGELWLLTHAVYGLQESPRLWGAYRDQLLAELRVEIEGKEVVLVQGCVESSWWRVQEKASSTLIGILVVYVDDILLCGATGTVRALAQAIQRLWKTSPLQFVEEKEIRFLGIEIARVQGGYSLSQKSYIEELLRIHQTSERRRDLVPLSKEAASFIATEDEAPQKESEIKQAQQIAGELLWISQRTRPDISFACSLVGSLATRAPRRATEIGAKVWAYLQRTWGQRFIYDDGGATLSCFVDASFAPDGARSHTGWLVALGGNVISWRSSRQSCITLSTAEAELEAATEGLVALQGIQAILVDIGVGPFDMHLHSDSTSALAIAHGSCSWRTRHLRLKSAWIGELVKAGNVTFNHCSGEVQPADMLTKPLSSGRLRSLSLLIGLVDFTDPIPGRDHEQSAASTDNATGNGVGSSAQHPSPIPKVLIALLLLSLATTVEATRDDQVVVYGSGVSVDYSLVTWMVISLLALGILMVWEGLKWAAWMIYDRATPGSRARRIRRLQRLRDATAEAIQKEVNQRIGNRFERRERDARTIPGLQDGSRPRISGESTVQREERRHAQEKESEERLKLLKKLAKGIKETADTAVQTSAFSPVQGPGTRVILRYVHEPPSDTFYVPDNECYHVYGDCHAFRHRGTKEKVQRRRLCQYCYSRAVEDPDKSADYGRDLQRAREYEDLFNTTLQTSGQSSGVSRT